MNKNKTFSINFGLFGIYFAWILQMANMSGIFAFYGAANNDLGKLWLALPVGGLFAQLLTGYLSDKTKSRYGARLPYIIVGAIGSATSLIFLPFAPTLSAAVVLLWCFTIAINVAMQPYRPLIADLVPEHLHTKSYSAQMIFVGLGSICAALLPIAAFHVFSDSGKSIPAAIKFTFIVGAVFLLISNFWTFFSSKKYLVRNIPVKEKTDINVFTKMPKIMQQVSLMQFFSWFGLFCFIVYLTPLITKNYNVTIAKSMALTSLAYFVYMVVNIIFAYCIPVITQKISRRSLHVFALSAGGLALFVISVVHTKIYFLLAMIGIGVAWASINSIPYAMIAGSIAKNKLGLYMGIFNIVVCLPQIIVSLIIGSMLKSWFHGNVAWIMILAGFSFIISALLAKFYVVEK